MKWIKFLSLTLIALVSLSAYADVTPEQKKLIEEQKKAYPIDFCVISGDKLDGGGMGATIEYLYTQTKDGKETVRLVRFCCSGCVKTFKKNPDKYLKILDDAAAKKAEKKTP